MEDCKWQARMWPGVFCEPSSNKGVSVVAVPLTAHVKCHLCGMKLALVAGVLPPLPGMF